MGNPVKEYCIVEVCRWETASRVVRIVDANNDELLQRFILGHTYDDKRLKALAETETGRTCLRIIGGEACESIHDADEIDDDLIRVGS